jgi:hypothetical protein
MSGGQVDDIERRAKAQVTTAKEESAKAENAEKALAAKPAAGDPAAKVYGDIALDALAPGLKMVSSAADFVGQRHADNEGAKVAHDVSRSGIEGLGRNARSIEEDIQGASRKPGSYRMPHDQNAFGAVSSAASSVRTKATAGEDLMASANIATMSLKDQHKEAVGSWDVKEGSTKMAGVALAKKLTFGQEMSNEQALQSVYVARQQHSATLGMANQISPGMSMAMNGPSFKANDVLAAAKNVSEWDNADRWRGTQS